jgi:hypothetical protein
MPGRKQKIENVAASQGNVLGDLVNLDDAKMDEHDVENGLILIYLIDK